MKPQTNYLVKALVLALRLFQLGCQADEISVVPGNRLKDFSELEEIVESIDLEGATEDELLQQFGTPFHEIPFEKDWREVIYAWDCEPYVLEPPLRDGEKFNEFIHGTVESRTQTFAYAIFFFEPGGRLESMYLQGPREGGMISSMWPKEGPEHNE